MANRDKRWRILVAKTGILIIKRLHQRFNNNNNILLFGHASNNSIQCLFDISCYRPFLIVRLPAVSDDLLQRFIDILSNSGPQIRPASLISHSLQHLPNILLQNIVSQEDAAISGAFRVLLQVRISEKL